MFSIIGFATLTGTPIAGALIASDNGGYTYAIVFSGVSMFLGAVFLLWARISRVGKKIMIKA
jgi:predicted MFS family arabinose efflux permease